MAKPSAQEKFLDDRRPDLERQPEREGEEGWNRSPRPLGSARLCRLAEEPLGCRPSMATEPAAA